MKSLLAPIAALAVALGGLALPAVFSTPAHAQTSPATYTAQLAPMNGTGSSGTVTISVEGNQATVTLKSSGLAPNLPHAQHIHIGGQHTCPTAGADANHDGHTTTTEGHPFYGDIMISLTTTGDVSANSGLAVDRMPTAAADGSVTYTRTFDLPPGVTPDMVGQGVVVQHGIDYSKDGTYDGAAKSDLDPSLPEEATDPANCGKIVPTGATASTTPAATTGAGSTDMGSMPGMSMPATGVTVPNTGTGPANSGVGTAGWLLLAGLGSIMLGSTVLFGATIVRRR